MRLTANVRAGHQWTLIGALILAAGTILPLITMLAVDFAANPKRAKALLTLALLLAGLGWWVTLGGIRKTHLTLNPCDSKEIDPAIPRQPQFSAPRTNELPVEPERERLSITEATTGLLNEVAASEPERVPIYRAEEKSS